MSLERFGLPLNILSHYLFFFKNQRKNSKLEYYYLYKYRLHCTHQISLWTYQSLLYVCCYLFVIETYITYIVLYYLHTYLLTFKYFFPRLPFSYFQTFPTSTTITEKFRNKSISLLLIDIMYVDFAF